jgi:KDO2-lipid IV(A) lauroyltransferase
MTLKHTLEYLAFRALRATWGVLPEGLAVRLGALLGILAGGVLRIRRREVDEHLTLVFPERDVAWRRRVALGSYAHLGRETALFFRMGRWTPERIVDRVAIDGFEPIREAAEREGGVVLLTGHLGGWEMAGAGIAARGLPLDVVGKGMANRRFERDLFAARARLGMNVIEMSGAAKGVLRSLGRGRVTAIVGDQNAHKHGIFLPFFGKLAATAKGPALFAIRTGAPVFVGFAIREPGWKHRYIATVRRLEYSVTGDHARDIRALLEAYHHRLEEAIRGSPDQYFWQHKRWKTRPPEEPGLSR